MKYINTQNIGTTPRIGSRHNARYIATSVEIGSPPKEYHSRHGSRSRRGSRLESHELLEESRGLRDQKDVNQVMGLMNENLTALMVRDSKLGSLGRRTSDLEDNALACHQKTRKPKR